MKFSGHSKTIVEAIPAKGRQRATQTLDSISVHAVTKLIFQGTCLLSRHKTSRTSSNAGNRIISYLKRLKLAGRAPARYLEAWTPCTQLVVHSPIRHVRALVSAYCYHDTGELHRSKLSLRHSSNMGPCRSVQLCIGRVISNYQDHDVFGSPCTQP